MTVNISDLQFDNILLLYKGLKGERVGMWRLLKRLCNCKHNNGKTNKQTKSKDKHFYSIIHGRVFWDCVTIVDIDDGLLMVIVAKC